jgi:hypothetical protein
MEVGLVRPSPTCPAQLTGGSPDLVPTDLVGRLEPLLAAILTEDAGRFESALESAIQLFK